jgi:hypothetical protein
MFPPNQAFPRSMWARAHRLRLGRTQKTRFPENSRKNWWGTSRSDPFSRERECPLGLRLAHFELWVQPDAVRHGDSASTDVKKCKHEIEPGEVPSTNTLCPFARTITRPQSPSWRLMKHLLLVATAAMLLVAAPSSAADFRVLPHRASP